MCCYRGHEQHLSLSHFPVLAHPASPCNSFRKACNTACQAPAQLQVMILALWVSKKKEKSDSQLLRQGPAGYCYLLRRPHFPRRIATSETTKIEIKYVTYDQSLGRPTAAMILPRGCLNYEPLQQLPQPKVHKQHWKTTQTFKYLFNQPAERFEAMQTRP